MATKKQRRRREKLQRHEYEYVVETDEGEEVPADSPRAAQSKGAGAKGTAKLVDRRGRQIRPPSWGRVLKRGAIFAPILAVLIFATSSNLSLTAQLLNVVLLLAIFLPFSYLTDMLLYRAVLRRHRRDHGS